jgi:hypothetical protein
MMDSSGRAIWRALRESGERPEVTREEFETYRTRHYGRMNPERMDNSFWTEMVRWGGAPFGLAEHLGLSEASPGPAWCFYREGATHTLLRDEFVVSIGGGHEDFFGPDSMVYNDVVIRSLNGRSVILGYPPDVFPPTDFHTATLIDDQIWIVGNLGYTEHRSFWVTPVSTLVLGDFVIRRPEIVGDGPGWISGHRAVLTEEGRIRVSGGRIWTHDSRLVPNESVWELDPKLLRWSPA